MKTLLTLLVAAACTAGTAHAQTVKGDAKAGAGKVAMCLGCHSIPGYQASFPTVFKVPMISGQTAPYLANALAAYKKGERSHPTMRSIAESMSEQDMADVAAFYAAQGQAEAPPAQPPAPPQDVAALLQKGACASCHGVNYSKPLDPSYPKLAGQYSDYLYHALRAYQVQDHPHLGRNNAIMSAQVKQFSSADLKAMAEYLGSLPGELRTVRQSPFK